MIRGLYSATTALDAAMQRQEVISHNLAHINTAGYRQRGVVFETFDRALGRATEPIGDLNGTRLVETYADFKPGTAQLTGNPFDVALDNDGFFVLQGPNGPLYSRSGNFRLGPQSQLVSIGGYPLQGGAGEITIPAGTANISIAKDGNVSADGVNVGQLQVVRFTNLRDLTQVGPSLFRAGDQAGLQQVADRGLLQGYRETSNVNPAQAMVDMVQESRYFDAAQRALRAIGEALQLNTRPQL